MAKVNQEEYQVLKAWSSKWKWIVRTARGAIKTFLVKPHKDSGEWLSNGKGNFGIYTTYSDLFQFIQWEDEEPYNIAELIEEYEYWQRIAQNPTVANLVGYRNESEETEVKDIEWLKEHITNILGGKVKYKDKNVIDDKYFVGLNNAYVAVLEMLESLEVETLTPEWIDELIHYSTDQDAFGNIVRIEMVPAKYLRNLLVPKQELPVIPKFVADYIDDRKEVGFPIYQAIRIVRENSRFEHSHLREWLWTNKGQETFVRAWLDGYTVEEEQKYIVSDNSSVPLLIKNDDGKVMSYDSQIAYNNSNGTIELTEQEIKDYDPRYWAFAKPVEEVK